jgi:sugar lactone lactonase YvrE
MRPIMALALCAVWACSPGAEDAAQPEAPPAAEARAAPAAALPLGMADATVFPGDLSLQRAEDGVILDDGRIVVADQSVGLRAVNPDQTSAPYGRFAEAGYLHSAEVPAGPNGVAFTPDRAHILVADIYTGAIWQVAVADESVRKIHQHAYGVNSAIADAAGAVWFTQSTANAPGAGAEARMFAAIDKPIPDGALFRLKDGAVSEMKSGLAFANGLAIDPARGALFVAETMADRVWRFPIDGAAGALGEGSAFATVPTPDNVKIGRDGAVFVASPLASALFVVDPETGAASTWFSAATPESEAIAAEWGRRVAAGEGAMELFTPDVWGAMPGAVTSVILTAEGDPAYLGTLGNALVRLNPPAR